MKTVKINYFGGGVARDYTRGGIGQSSISKQFDIFTYPFRLQPLRGMTSTNEPTNTGLANMILGANGVLYGVGEDPNNPGNGELYKRVGFGGSDTWTDFTTDQLSGVANTTSSIDFLVHYPEMGAVRKLFWAGTGVIVASDPLDGGSSIDTEALSFTTIGQGLVHPKDKVLYIPYQTSTATLIAKNPSHATDAFGNWNASALTAIPSRFRVYCLSHLRDFLAIPMTLSGQIGQSYVALWDKDTTLNTLSDLIPWGTGALKVLNNLDGALIGISVESAEIGSDAAQDIDKIVIRVSEGGAAPIVVGELIATRLTTTAPSCVLNHRVNFIHNNRLYFSANIVNGTSNANYYGLWSVGKNNAGQWTVVLERLATNTESAATPIIAAALRGDFFSCVHTTAGTLTYTLNGNTLSGIYDATSVHESVINPEMPEEDKDVEKQLMSVYATYLPLPADAQVVMKYRVDSNLDDSWTTIFTETSDGRVYTEASKAASAEFSKGRKYEFRLESTDGAIITGYGYKYKTFPTLI